MLFKNILVPFDNSVISKRALNKAIALANLTDAKIILVHVIDYHKAMAKIVGPYKGTMIGHVKKIMDNVKKHASKEKVIVETQILMEIQQKKFGN